MAFPTTQVYIAFNDGPMAPSPTWTEVTTYVRQINIQRGRDNELSDFESGNATVVLDNRDRRFDPFYKTGPYYGTGTSLVPRRQIKIEATMSSVVYPVFRGFIEGWPVSITDAGYDTTVTVQCFDALGLLTEEELPDDISSAYILSLSPRHYWPLDDPIDPQNFTSTQLIDLGSSPQPLTNTNTATLTANADGLAPALPNTSCSLYSVDTLEGWRFSTTAIAATDTTISKWFAMGSDSTYYPIAYYGLSHAVVGFYSATTNIIQIYTYNGTTRTSATCPAFLDRLQPHHIGIVTDSTGAVTRIVLDGVDQTVTQSNSANTTPAAEYFASYSGKNQQVAIWSSALTLVQIQTIFRLGRGLLTEGTVARFNRVIGYTTFPSALTSTPSATYSATLSEISTGGPPVTDELQTISDSEGGNLFVSRNGTLTLTSRFAIFQGTSYTSQATFGGAGITIGTELAYRLDAKNLRNTLAVGYSGDGSVEAVNAASVTAYGTAGGSWSTQLSSVADAQALANLLVGFSGTPAVVIDPLEVNVSATDASWTTILGLELLNRFTLNIVQQVGSAITLSQILQSIDHTITPDRWITTINGSVRFTNPFILGTSLLGRTELIL